MKSIVKITPLIGVIVLMVTSGLAQEVKKTAFDDEIITELLESKSNASPDWKRIYKKLKKKYTANEADSAIKVAKIRFYENNTPEYEKVLTEYMIGNLNKMHTGDINNYAWEIFKRSNNEKVLKDAMKWVEFAIKHKESNSLFNSSSPYFDTYANLLYKLGHKDDAIIWQEKAVNDAPAQDKRIYEATLAKMKKGERTWK
jgi:tetratricopeptide (TPR) repeat protein